MEIAPSARLQNPLSGFRVSPRPGAGIVYENAKRMYGYGVGLTNTGRNGILPNKGLVWN